MQEVPVSHWYRDWVNDYRAICRAEHRRVFTFTPDTPVTTPAEFTDALFGYARAQGLNLVVTREGMYPHFTIDGIEYRAVRYYASVRGIPTARVRCVCCDPEFAEADVSSWRLRLMKGLHYAAPALFMLGIALLFLVPRGLLREWWGIAILVSLTAAGISAAWYNAHFYYNDKDNQPHKNEQEPAYRTCRYAGSFFLYHPSRRVRSSSTVPARATAPASVSSSALPYP